MPYLIQVIPFLYQLNSRDEITGRAKDFLEDVFHGGSPSCNISFTPHLTYVSREDVVIVCLMLGYPHRFKMGTHLVSHGPFQGTIRSDIESSFYFPLKLKRNGKFRLMDVQEFKANNREIGVIHESMGRKRKITVF